MLVRVGNGIYWLCTGVAALLVLGSISFALMSLEAEAAAWVAEERLTTAEVFAVLAIVVWLIGRAARYFMAGR